MVQSIDVYAVDGTKILNEALPGEKIDLRAYVPATEIASTAYVQGVEEKSILSQKDNLFSFDNIQITKAFRTFCGTGSYTPPGTIPEAVDPKKVIQSVQTWYGEYYLPSDVHILPKNYDINAYVREQGGIDFTEDIWLDKGYIVVNFDIVTYQEGADAGHLSYINKENALHGYCNMWKLEGAQLSKTDSKGTKISFKYGDYLLYYTDKSATQDYLSGGTH